MANNSLSPILAKQTPDFGLPTVPTAIPQSSAALVVTGLVGKELSLTESDLHAMTVATSPLTNQR
jgi:DMSO/TMAO reductase YedYZ molybdopterin-dependent catalytic subunit